MDTGACDINKQNKAGYTAIMLASLAQINSDRQRDIVRRMFEMGDVNARASQVHIHQWPLLYIAIIRWYII